jgi:Undecaprenyl-phosphate glucose phosphotransferase
MKAQTMRETKIRRPGKANEHPGIGAKRNEKRMFLENYVVTLMMTDLASIGIGGLWQRTTEIGYFKYSSEILNTQTAVVAITFCLFGLVSQIFNAYRVHGILDRSSVTRPIAALTATFGLVIVIGVATKTSENYSRIWFFSWLATALALMLTLRLLILATAQRKLAAGGYIYRALSVGLFADPLTGSDITEFTRGQAVLVDEIRLNRLEEIDQLAETIAYKQVDVIYHTAPWVDAPLLLQKLRKFKDLSAEIYVVPIDARMRADHLGAVSLGGRVTLHAAARPIAGWSQWRKRALDVCVASFVLALFAPMLVLVALAIKLESPGPALFRQQRVGVNGRPFEVLKFRSMRIEATDLLASRQTSRNDNRLTRVGRIIRRLSIDEIPQLINVLRGNMSIVGPRPHAPGTTANGEALLDVCDDYASRHRVMPGLTGLAQVNGFRGELDTVDKARNRVACDLAYIENWSIWLDMKIILRTALLLVYDKSAY